MSELPPPPPLSDAPFGEARILERGYRRYEGERRGLGASIRAVWVYSMQRMLGLRRSVWSKLLPAAVIFISYVPAIVFVGVVALSKNDPQVSSNLPTYSDYYSYVSLAVVLFAAFSAPDVLCPDRRTGMLGLYLASPLDRNTYLVGKAAAIMTGLLLVTAGPQLLFLVANIMQGATGNSAGGNVMMAVRILGAGVVVAALFTSVTMAISSFTDRRGIASASVILVFFASGAVGGALQNAHPPFALLGLAVQLPDALTTRTFGVVSRGVSNGIDTALVWSVGIGLITACALLTRFRYARMEVTR